MSAQIESLTKDPGIGRLPPPVVERALSERQFKRLAETWRHPGVWVSLWNADGHLIDEDHSPAPFWQAFRSAAAQYAENLFTKSLNEIARRILANSAASPNAGAVFLVPFSPTPEDICVAAMPIRIKRRCVGAVIAMATTSRPVSEEFQRLCGGCGLDVRHMTSLRENTSGAGDRIKSWAPLLGMSVEQARELDNAQGEIISLTYNLQSTYEELHLIYEISRLMGIPQKPTQMLERVSREMLEVSRAAGLAFVLTRKDSAEAPTRRGENIERPAGNDYVVMVGKEQRAASDLIRLDQLIPPAEKAEADHILVNQAAKRPEFDWAAPWLNHFVALPLRLEKEVLGTFYAINVIDDGDFTSVDIQLLKAVADRISAALKNQHLYDDLADLLMGLMHALVNSVDAKDTYTFGHSERVAFFSRSIAQAAGLSKIDCERVYLAGLLHDVGKIGVPDAILTKPGKLTAEEFESLKKHPEIGERILSHIRQLSDLLPGVLYHHERMDGRGYPHGLVGREIPLLGRIICLADSFDAMTSNRTYRAALPIAVATSEIRRCSGNQFDPELAEVFLKVGPEKLFEEAQQNAKGDPNLARIGALCTALSAWPRNQSIGAAKEAK